VGLAPGTSSCPHLPQRCGYLALASSMLEASGISRESTMAGRNKETVDIKELEQEVAIAELKMRKAEAAVRLHAANEKIREIRSGKTKG
jgi:hypothetical protein